MRKVVGDEMVQWVKVPGNSSSFFGTHNTKRECVLSAITGIELTMNTSPHLQIQHRKRIYNCHLCSVLLCYPKPLPAVIFIITALHRYPICS